VAKLERALFAAQPPATPPEGFSRLYYGAEFCFWRLPDPIKIRQTIRWCRDAGWPLTLVTPVVGEEERLRLARLLAEVVPLLEAGDELLISDWAALELVRSNSTELPIVLGRALSGQKRGPRILDMSLSAEQQSYFQKGCWHNQQSLALLAEHSIARIEQDNLLQGLAPLPKPLKGSLHLPYAMVTSSRNCPFRLTAKDDPCPAPCGELFTLKAQDTDILLYQDGNAQFLRNDRAPNDLTSLGIDRLVFTP